MTQRQIEKPCFISQTIAMGTFKHSQHMPFIRKLEHQSDDYRLSAYEAEKLNKVYLDNVKAIKRLERMQL